MLSFSIHYWEAVSGKVEFMVDEKKELKRRLLSIGYEYSHMLYLYNNIMEEFIMNIEGKSSNMW